MTTTGDTSTQDQATPQTTPPRTGRVINLGVGRRDRGPR